MKRYLRISLSIIVFVILKSSIFAQTNDTIPYRVLPELPEKFSTGGMASRLMDGFGFRFYWATEGLNEKDLSYRPTVDSRSVEETIDHIFSMTSMIALSVIGAPSKSIDELSFEEKRAQILSIIQSVSEELLKSDSDDFENYKIELKNGETLPFWYFVNGQITDAIWHCGQIASFRRITGNPFNSNVSLFRGTVND